MTYRTTDPNALEVRRDALDRASSFLDRSAHTANARGPGGWSPTVADLTEAADAILAWMIQPLPGDPNAEPEPAQQATNVQAAPQFRDLSNIVRHTGPSGVWHLGPYQTCTICQVGHGAVSALGECSPLAQKQHALAEAQINRVIPGVGPSAKVTDDNEVQSAPANAPKSAEPNTTRTPMDEGPSLSLVRERDHAETGLSKTYKRPY